MEKNKKISMIYLFLVFLVLLASFTYAAEKDQIDDAQSILGNNAKIKEKNVDPSEIQLFDDSAKDLAFDNGTSFLKTFSGPTLLAIIVIVAAELFLRYKRKTKKT